MEGSSVLRRCGRGNYGLSVSSSYECLLQGVCAHRFSRFSMSAWEYEAPTTTPEDSRPGCFGVALRAGAFQNGELDLVNDQQLCIASYS
jgi:hypothetical protein